jgi:hypothetical protein
LKVGVRRVIRVGKCRMIEGCYRGWGKVVPSRLIEGWYEQADRKMI